MRSRWQRGPGSASASTFTHAGWRPASVRSSSAQCPSPVSSRSATTCWVTAARPVVPCRGTARSRSRTSSGRFSTPATQASSTLNWSAHGSKPKDLDPPPHERRNGFRTFSPRWEHDMTFGDGPADKSLRDAWSRFCDQLKDAGDSVFKDANPGAPMMRADAFRFLTQNLGQAFDLALETKDPAFPQIHPLCTPTRKLGGDVADFTYRQAWIDGNHTYKITGTRGTARWLNITVQGPRPATIPGTDWPSLHEPFGDIPEANIFGHQLSTDGAGNFELFIGGPERAENWLPTTTGSRKLFIREAFDAWFETPTALTIERIGMQVPRPQPDPESMMEAMGWAGDFLAGAMRDWPEHSWKYSGGVGDRLFRPVSYTPARTVVYADDGVRFVIGHADPGVHNWLDSQGFSDVNR